LATAPTNAFKTHRKYSRPSQAFQKNWRKITSDELRNMNIRSPFRRAHQ